MELKVEIVAIDFIQPSSLNPNHPKLHKLSLLDQLAPPRYIPLVLYYTAAVAQEQASILQHIKRSLSNILSHFYLFAGRINANRTWIDCSSTTNTANGVPFKEAHALMDLAEVVAKRDPEVVSPLLPDKGSVGEDALMIPLQIQATFFRCGGLSLGICASHLVLDALALSEFIRFWAACALERAAPVMPLDLFLIRSLLPSSNLVKPQQLPITNGNLLATKCFVFSGESVSALKLHAANANGDQPTRVQVVSALVWKSMMNAVSKSKSTNSSTNGNSSSILVVFANMRTRFEPPLPQNSSGNFVGFFNIQKDYDDEDISSMNLCDLTDLQKYGLNHFCDNYIKRLQVNKEDRSAVVLELKEASRKTYTREDVDLFTVSSWCGFKFYEIDFGWGKPTWVSTNYGPLTNFCLLIDTKEGDGVEAWVSLEKEAMAAFEQDKELLSFASFLATTPSISSN